MQICHIKEAKIEKPVNKCERLTSKFQITRHSTGASEHQQILGEERIKKAKLPTSCTLRRKSSGESGGKSPA